MLNIRYLKYYLAVAVVAFAAWGNSPPAEARKSSGRPAPFVGDDLQGLSCQGARIPFGPFDYLQRNKFQGELFITEEYHLTPEILQLKQATTTTAINDIQYTLMAWPNHHTALYAAYQFRLLNRGKFRRGINDPSPVECHLQRAINFSPRDPVPYMIYGLLLHKFEQYQAALKAFRRANKLLPNDVITLYNMGLTLVALEYYEEAVDVATEVYSTDFPLDGLKKQLIAAGHWESEGPGDAPAPEEEGVQNELSAETTVQPSPETELSPETENPPAAPQGENSGDEGVDLAVVRE